MHALKPVPKKGVDTRAPNELELYEPEYTVLSLVSWSGCAPVTESCAWRAGRLGRATGRGALSWRARLLRLGAGVVPADGGNNPESLQGAV
jgi:hypothetical protein